jgi:hypothetical protein
MMEDISLEDIAMGIMPKKAKDKKVSAATLASIKAIMSIIKGVEGKSIADYKKLPMQDKKALMKAYDELGDACYTAKSLIRESRTEEEKKNSRGSIGIMMSDEMEEF